MNQKLSDIKQIVDSLEKDRELSFSTFSKILVRDKVNEDNFKKIREKYRGIDLVFKWVQMFTSFWNRTVDYWFKMNLYKTDTWIKGWYKEYLWGWYWPKTDLYTIFKINSGKEFIFSVLSHIESIKENELVLLSESKQKENLRKIINKAQESFWKDEFEINFSYNQYFESTIQYLHIIQKEHIEIKNIILFRKNIKFILKRENCTSQNKILELTFTDIPYFWVLRYWEKEYKFKKWKNTYLALIESLNRKQWEYIDFIDMVDILSGKKDQDNLKMVSNAVAYANATIEEELKIKNFFLVENKAYSRQYLVNRK